MKQKSLATMTIIGLLTVPVMGQGPQASPRPTPLAMLVFDLDFPGGSLEALVADVEKAVGTKPNIILASPQAGRARLPALSLRSVTLPALMEMLKALIEDRRDTGLRVRAMGGRGHPIMIVSAAKDVEKQATHTRAYMIEPHLTRFTMDDITTAVQTAWEMAGLGRHTRLKFHEDTKLLIAVVSCQEELDLIRNVLEELGKGVTAFATDAATRRQPLELPPPPPGLIEAPPDHE